MTYGVINPSPDRGVHGRAGAGVASASGSIAFVRYMRATPWPNSGCAGE